MIKEERLLRRIIHSMVWIFLIYYLIPDTIYGYPKRLLFVVLITGILSFEALRLYFGFKVYGMRHYEERQIASYAWATMAASISLLFFPIHIAFVSLVGMGVVDPLIGEIEDRASDLYPYVPFIVWSIIAFSILVLFTDFNMTIILVMSLIGSAVALIAEYPSIIIDDDFLMIVAPLFVLQALEILLV